MIIQNAEQPTQLSKAIGNKIIQVSGIYESWQGYHKEDNATALNAMNISTVPRAVSLTLPDGISLLRPNHG